MLLEWRSAQQLQSRIFDQYVTLMQNTWRQPLADRLKCNIDAFFSTTSNDIGIKVYVRGGDGQFVIARAESVSSITKGDLWFSSTYQMDV